MAELNERQRLFVEAYLEDPNATRAAIKAGYSSRSARALGCQLLTNVNVAAAIEQGRAERRERARLKADDIIHELEKLAMFDPRELTVSLEDYNREVAELVAGGMTLEDAQLRARHPGTLKGMHELTLEQARAVVERYSDTNGPRVKVYSRERALELLAKHHGLLEDKVRMKVDQGVDLSKLSDAQLAMLEEILGHASPED